MTTPSPLGDGAVTRELLPQNLVSLGDAKPHVVRIMDQGESEADGYYAFYTALLMTHNEEHRLLDFSFRRMIFSESGDGLAVRADLIVRTLLAFGLDQAERSLRHHNVLVRDGVFNKISDEEVQKLIDQLRSRV